LLADPDAALLLTGCQAAKEALKGREPPVEASLAGGPWLVEDVNGGGVPGDVALDISFEAGAASGKATAAATGEGRLSGRSGCNRFTGTWFQLGGSVRFGALAATRTACPPATMALEAKFLATLVAATAVHFDAAGAAYLAAPDGRQLRLRRAA
jgi:heat shock protein HslJ